MSVAKKLEKNIMTKKHGYAKRGEKHPLYHKFISMKQRCYCKTRADYARYGGRGITICEDWLNSPERFVEWGLNNGWEAGLTIDRIDNNKGYSPENCQFITLTENSRKTRLIHTTNKSGYRGVSWCKKMNKWKAQAGRNGKKYCQGHFTNKLDAAVARDSFVISKRFGLPLNFPQPIERLYE